MTYDLDIRYLGRTRRSRARSAPWSHPPRSGVLFSHVSLPTAPNPFVKGAA